MKALININFSISEDITYKGYTVGATLDKYNVDIRKEDFHNYPNGNYSGRIDRDSYFNVIELFCKKNTYTYICDLKKSLSPSDRIFTSLTMAKHYARYLNANQDLTINARSYLHYDITEYNLESAKDEILENESDYYSIADIFGGR